MPFFSFTKAYFAAFGTFRKSVAAHVNANRKLIPFRLKFGLTMRTNEGHIHQNNISHHGDYGNRNCDSIPRNVNGRSKPVDLAGAQNSR